MARPDLPCIAYTGEGAWGIQLMETLSFAQIAKSMGAEGITVNEIDQVGPALQKATELQMKEGKPCILELMCTKELGDPFRRDAMKLPKRYLPQYKATEELYESKTEQPVDVRRL